MNDLTTSRHPRLRKQEDGRSFPTTRGFKPKGVVNKTGESYLVSIRSLEVMK